MLESQCRIFTYVSEQIYSRFHPVTMSRTLRRTLVALGVITTGVFLYRYGDVDPGVLDWDTNVIHNNVIHNNIQVKLTSNDPQNSKGAKKVEKVLIVTYQRSGSTFLSELLKQTDNVFYSMEPLWAIYKKCHRTKNDITCRNDKHRNASSHLQTAEETLQILKNVFECKLSSLPNEVLESFRIFGISSGYTELKQKKCFSSIYRQNNNIHHQECVNILFELCNRSSAILVKTIRISMEIALDLRKLKPDIKIVHLFRDPRAVLFSRHVIHDLDFTNIHSYSRQLCSRILNDMNVIRTTATLHLPVFYDCFVRDPFQMTKYLYSFLHFNYSMTTEKWIVDHMMSNRTLNDKSHFHVKFSNSVEISSAWRKDMSFNVVQDIDRNCGGIFQILGIQTFPTETALRNLTIPSIKLTEYTRSICAGSR